MIDNTKNAEAVRNYHKRNRANGVCPNCGKQLRAQRSYCSDCGKHGAKSQAKRRQAWIESGLCISCGGERDDHRSTCDKCRGFHRVSNKKRVANRRANGLCVCGRNPVSGHTQCEPCIVKGVAQRNGYKSSTSAWKLLITKLEQQNFTCPYSGVHLAIGVNASLDHLLPLSRGGDNSLDNLQWVSFDVNQMKTNLLHDEFLAMCKAITDRNAAGVI